MTARLSAARRRSALLAGAALAAALAATPQAAFAWKPKTHIYLAEEALKDAVVDGKVTIRETDYRTGKIIGVIGEFDVDPRILKALRAAPMQFRAGVLGPDAYPDILTGQQIIHPDAAEPIDGAAGGSNAWLTHIWERGFEAGDSDEVRAFTVGYLTHAAGDVFAHTFVNHFAGGEFLLVPDPTNAAKHLVLEGYVGKRTPQTISASGAVVTQESISIAGLVGFIHDELTYARPGSVLEAKLMKGDGTTRSIPYIFSKLRNGLQQQVDEYDRVRMSKRGPARLAYAAANGPAAEYKRAWIKDIDEGLVAFAGVSHDIAKAIVYNENGSDMAQAKAVMNRYVTDHLASMAGAPDALVATAAFLSGVIDSILPPPMREAFKALMQAPMDALIKGVTGRTADQWADYLKNPDTHFDEVLNRPGGGHGGEVEHPIDLATFNRDYLKIADTGYSNPGLTWKIDDLPPAFNTVQLTKLMLLGDRGLAQLDAALKAKNAPMGAAPGRFQNVMLGWVRSLDAGNQWQGLTPASGGASPQPAFAGPGGAAYQHLFLRQVGEKPWIDDAPGQAGSAPDAGVVQDLTPWTGDWETTFGTVKLTLGEDGVLRGRLMEGERESDRLELRSGSKAGEVVGVGRYAGITTHMVLTLGADQAAFTGTVQGEGSTSKSAWSGKRPATAPAPTPASDAPPPPDPAPAPGSTSTQAPGRDPPPSPVPAPASGPVTGAAAQPLEHFQVRMDEARTTADRRVQVTVTLKNISPSPQRVLTGVFTPILNDADGLGMISAQVYRADREPPELFATTPTAPPGGEFRIRFLFQPFSGGAPLRSFTLREADGADVAVFDLSGLRMSGSAGVPRPASATRSFEALGPFDVRFDGGGSGRDGYLEAYFAFRNASEAPQTIQPGALELALLDAGGGSTAALGQLFSVRGTASDPLGRSVTIEPGAEARLRFKFRRPDSAPRTLRIGNGRDTLTYTLSGP